MIKLLKKKQFLGVAISTFVSVFFAAGFVFAAVTVSTNIQVGDGAGTGAGINQTLNGDDLYIEGTLEVDGTSNLDNNVTIRRNFTGDATASASDVVLTINNASTTAADPYIAFQINGTNQFVVGVDDTASNIFRIAGLTTMSASDQEGLTITTGGNVGIGTTNPGQALSIDGNLEFVGVQTISTTAGDLIFNPNDSVTFSSTSTLSDDIRLTFGTDNDIVMLRSALVAADAEVDLLIEGTSDHPGVAADSLILSNITNDGDILFLVSKSGDSLGVFWADGSTGDTAIMAASGQSVDVYIAGTKEYDFNASTLDMNNNTLTNVGASSNQWDSTSLLITTGILDMNDNRIDFDADNDTSIRTGADDQFNFEIAGVDQHQWTASSTVFNSGALDVDFVIQGTSEANLFKIDGATDRVGIATSTPDSLFTVYSIATTTIEMHPSSTTQGTCFVLKNNVGTLTYMRIVGTTVTANTNDCR